MADNIAQSGRVAKALDTPLAHRFAEMCLLRDELRLCLSAIRLWTSRIRQGGDEDYQRITEALLRDAIVQFTACFGDGEDRLSPAAAFGDIEGWSDYLGWLRDVRDSYAAHRFGILRQAVPAAILGDDNSAIGVGYLASVYCGPGEERDYENLLMFFGSGLGYAARVVDQLGTELLSEARAMSPEALASLPNARLEPVVAAEFIRMTRENYRKPKSRRRARQQYRRRQDGSDPPAQKS
jgi:hypothetical protein